jgi:cytochrome oxidase Cu insertion factor (SCO1/SenC/PrrC family)
MNPQSRSLQWFVWGALLLTVAAIALAYLLSETKRRQVNLPVYGRVGSFTLTNQFDQPVTSDTLRGYVWVADVIFTRCPGPCLRMSQQMAQIRNAIAADKPVKLISLTADPEFDTPEVLQRYARRFGPEDDRWWFLTGPKAEVYRLTIDDLKLGVTELTPDQRKNVDDLFIHSTYFILVDKRGQLRGSPIDGTETNSLRRLTAAIDRLLRED